MTRDQQIKLVDEWMQGRAYVKCGGCGDVITSGNRGFTCWPQDDGSMKVLCFPCQDRHDEDPEQALWDDDDDDEEED